MSKKRRTSFILHVLKDKSLWSNVFGRRQLVTKNMLPMCMKLEQYTLLSYKNHLAGLAYRIQEDAKVATQALQAVYDERTAKLARLSEILVEGSELSAQLEIDCAAATHRDPDAPSHEEFTRKLNRARALRDEKDQIKMLPCMSDSWLGEMVDITNKKTKQLDEEHVYIGYLIIHAERPYTERVLMAWGNCVHTHRIINGLRSPFSMT